jgi:hypothetical protein
MQLDDIEFELLRALGVLHGERISSCLCEMETTAQNSGPDVLPRANC